MEGRGLD